MTPSLITTRLRMFTLGADGEYHLVRNIAAQIDRRLPVAEPWSLDALERFIWRLTVERILHHFGLLGCWVNAPDEFVVVVRHPAAGDLGFVVSRTDPARTPDAVAAAMRDAAATGVRPDVGGWVRAGIGWNTDPADLVLPWTGHPPAPGDPLVVPGGRTDWPVEPPSDDDIPADAAVIDLHSTVHDMWADTLLPRLITFPTIFGRSKLRLAACWVAAPDMAAYIESHLYPPPGHPADRDLLRRSLAPGQRRLRFGSYLIAGTSEGPADDSWLSWRRIFNNLDGGDTYPQAAVNEEWKVIDRRIVWQRHPTIEKLKRRDAPALTHMSDLLATALDTEQTNDQQGGPPNR